MASAGAPEHLARMAWSLKSQEAIARFNESVEVMCNWDRTTLAKDFKHARISNDYDIELRADGSWRGEQKSIGGSSSFALIKETRVPESKSGCRPPQIGEGFDRGWGLDVIDAQQAVRIVIAMGGHDAVWKGEAIRHGSGHGWPSAAYLAVTPYSTSLLRASAHSASHAPARTPWPSGSASPEASESRRLLCLKSS